MDRGRRAEGFGCKALRVRSLNEFKEVFGHARALVARAPRAGRAGIIVEPVTNVSKGTEIHSVNEFDAIRR